MTITPLVKPGTITPVWNLIRPINGITPFTYRDGRTFLEVLEELRSQVNADLIPGLNDMIDTLVEQLNESNTDFAGQVNIVFSDLEALIDSINNRVGGPEVQHITLTSDQELVIDPFIPTNHVITYDVKNTGNYQLTLPPNVSGSLYTVPGVDAITRFTLTPVGDGQYTLQQDTPGVVNVLEFGAKGDGVTDDTAAIQSAIDYVATRNSGHVFIPANTYKVSTLYMKGKVGLYGEGRASIIEALVGDAPLITNYSNNSTDTTITNLVLKGNKATGTADGHGIHYNFTGGPAGKHNLSNLFIDGVSGHGVFFAGHRSGESIVSNIQIYMCDGVGFYWNCHDTIITNVDVGQSGSAGFLIKGGNNRFTGCNAWFTGRLSPADGYGWYFAPPLTGGGQNQMTGCQSQDTTSHGVFISGQNRNSFTGFYIDGANSIGEGVDSGQGAAGLSITNSAGTSFSGMVVNRFPVLTTPYAANISSTATGSRIDVKCENMGVGGVSGAGLAANENIVNVSSSNVNHTYNTPAKGAPIERDVVSTGGVDAGATHTAELFVNQRTIPNYGIGVGVTVTIVARNTAAGSTRLMATIPLVIAKESGFIVSVGELVNTIGSVFSLSPGANLHSLSFSTTDGKKLSVSVKNGASTTFNYQIKVS